MSSGTRIQPARTLPVQELVRATGGTLIGPGDGTVQGITHDSREVSEGFAFVALPGRERDGREFVPDAVARGAAAVVAEGEPTKSGIAWVRVPEPRLALARASSAFYGHPDRSLAMAGVTGTNGKTTTTILLRSVLESAGRETGLMGTLWYRFGGHEEKAPRTTPEAPVVCRWLREMADAGAWGCVLEVSSHALALERVGDLEFDLAVFTNLGREHLDFHGGMDDYFHEKSRLFAERLKPDGVAVVNWDDERGKEIARISRGRVLPFGASDDSEVRIAEVEMSAAGLWVRLEGLASIEICSPLLGRVNVHNLAAAAASALALEVDPATVARGLASAPQVPGRFERVLPPEGSRPLPTVLVDYAHTDDALRSLLLSLRELSPRRILLVFGCGGDRDREKRPLMGAVAARHADVVVVTSDNPRTEDPATIAGEVLRGARAEPGVEIYEEPDRAAALALALDLAGPEDVVVAAGKGHEGYQEIEGVRHPHDDREILRTLLREAGA